MLLIFLALLVVFGSCLLIFSNSPYFGVFGVLTQSLAFSVLLCFFGVPFFGLLIVLIYIGGMLVVFLFSTILSAERYPSTGSWEVLLFSGGLSTFIYPLLYSWETNVESLGFLTLESESNLGEIFGCLGIFTCLVGIVLLVALMVVLTFGFEHGYGQLRKL
uniref:NADH-ubiquinone oxidoreductase chain 6 n=1 Tax=Ophioceres incipiens TaxID=1815129 RepID=A0A3G2WI84_9ECHI|nr:NADH dehydrogenase subunit 6 [Ophioceres incipiens]AYO99645.1 NADH dehydrogenase subunit 6 [Ophioceres incipiens]